MLTPEMKAVIDDLVTALKTKNHRVVDALLMNPPLRATIVLDPEVPASVYVTMFTTVDPRFRDLQPEIAAYLEHVRSVETENPSE